MAEMGIKSPQIQSIILELTQKNYCEGPKSDSKYPNHNVWIFGYDFDEIEIYVKLSDNFSHNIAKCISFHKSKYPLSYPYK